MTEYWSSFEDFCKETYKVHFEQVLSEAQSYNYKLSEDELLEYHMKLVEILKTLKADSASVEQMLENIFNGEIKKKNETSTCLKRLIFAKDKCQSNDQKFHAFVEGFIKDIMLISDDRCSVDSPIPGSKIETTLFEDFFEKHGLTLEEINLLFEKTPAKSFKNVFDSKVQHGKHSITDEVLHTTKDLEFCLLEMEAELFVYAPEEVKPIEVGFNTEYSIVQVNQNKGIAIPIMVLSKEYSTFEAICNANINYNVTISIGQKDQIIRSFNSSPFKVKILALGSLFESPTEGTSGSNMSGPIIPNSIRKSLSVEGSSEVTRNYKYCTRSPI